MVGSSGCKRSSVVYMGWLEARGLPSPIGEWGGPLRQGPPPKEKARGQLVRRCCPLLYDGDHKPEATKASRTDWLCIIYELFVIDPLVACASCDALHWLPPETVAQDTLFMNDHCAVAGI